MDIIKEIKTILKIVKMIKPPSEKEVNRIARISFTLMLIAGFIGVLVSLIIHIINML